MLAARVVNARKVGLQWSARVHRAATLTVRHVGVRKELHACVYIILASIAG